MIRRFANFKLKLNVFWSCYHCERIQINQLLQQLTSLFSYIAVTHCSHSIIWIWHQWKFRNKVSSLIYRWFSGNNGSFSRFAQDSLTFQCRYSRSINVDESMNIEMGPSLITGEGSLNYEMSVSGGQLGGTTEVRITPLHNFDQITPRWDSFTTYFFSSQNLFKCQLV